MWTTIGLSAWMFLAAVVLLVGKAASMVGDFQCQAVLRAIPVNQDVVVPPSG